MQFSGTHTHTGFLDLICDAVFQLRLSDATTDSYAINRHARASIIASALTIACCANCLLDSLTLQSKLEEDIEMLRPLSKFDLFLRLSRSDKQLERGDFRVNKVADLIRLRNEFVHPKMTAVPANFRLLVEEQDVVKWPIEMTSSIYSSIRISKNSMFWAVADAKAALSALLEFFSYFFSELLNVDDQMIKRTLMQRSYVQLGNTQIHIESSFDEFEAELKWAASHGFNVRFLGFPPNEK